MMSLWFKKRFQSLHFYWTTDLKEFWRSVSVLYSFSSSCLPFYLRVFFSRFPHSFQFIFFLSLSSSIPFFLPLSFFPSLFFFHLTISKVGITQDFQKHHYALNETVFFTSCSMSTTRAKVKTRLSKKRENGSSKKHSFQHCCHRPS